MDYLLKKKKAIMSVVNQNHGFLKTVSGEPPLYLENTLSTYLNDYHIHGNSVQNGTPSLESPVAIESCGDYDEATGKYIVEILTDRTITNVYLDEPLRKLGDYSDYIDFKNQRVARRVGCTNIKSAGVYSNSIGKAIPCVFNDWGNNPNNVRLVGTPILCTHDTQTMSAGPLSGVEYHMWAHNVQSSAQYIYWGFPYSILSKYSDVPLGTTSTVAELKEAFTAYAASEEAKGTPIMLYWVMYYTRYEYLSLPRISVKSDVDAMSFGTTVNPSNIVVEYFSSKP